MATRQTLEDRLRRHRRRLEMLETQRTNYGVAVPDKLAADILREEDAIEQIETELATLSAQHLLSDSAADDAEQQAIMDAQLSRIEMKLDTVNERLYDARTRMSALERDMQQMTERMKRLEAQIELLQHGPQSINRSWLLSGAVLLAAVFVVVLMLAWRLL